MSKIISTSEQSRLAREQAEVQLQQTQLQLPVRSTAVTPMITIDDYEIIVPGQDLERPYSDRFVGKRYRCQYCKCAFKLRPSACVFWEAVYGKWVYYSGTSDWDDGGAIFSCMNREIRVVTYEIFAHRRDVGIFVPCPSCRVRKFLRRECRSEVLYLEERACYLVSYASWR